jgi:hypothetical protein
MGTDRKEIVVRKGGHMPKIEYDDYKKLIYARAWSYCRTTGLPVEDFISEGNIIFCKAAQKHKPKHGAFSTYLTTALNNRFYNYALQEWREVHLAELDLSIPTDTHTMVERGTAFKQMVDGLSDEAKQIVAIFMHFPGELIEFGEQLKPKFVRGKLTRFLRAYGWSHGKIERSYNELRGVLYG